MTTKDIIKITINLVIVYIVGGLILAGVYAKTSPIMFRKALEEKQAALKEMMPDADNIEKLGDWEPYHKHAEYFVAKRGEDIIGYIAEGFGKGYSSYINVYTSVDTDFVVQKIKVLSHAETPGLGDEIEREYFLKQFAGKTIDHLVVRKEETQDDIQAISGATISTRAVAEDGVKKGVEMLQEKISSEVSEVSDEPKH